MTASPFEPPTDKVTDDTPAERAGSKNRIMRAFSLQLIGRIFGTLASVITVSITTRYLGANDYGVLTSAVFYIALWSSLTELGIGSVIVRRVTSGVGDLQQLVATNAGLSIIYCLPLAGVAAGSGLLVYGGDERLRTILVIVAGGLLLTTLSTCYAPVFLVTVRFTAVALADLLSRVGSLCATALILATSANLVWFAVVQLVPPFVQMLVLAIGARRIISLRPIFSVKGSWDLIKESLPQTGVLVIAVIYWRADGVILTVFSRPAEVGTYGLAFTLAFTTSVVATFFLSSTLATMTERYANDQKDFAHFIRSSMQTMVFLGVPIATVGAVLAGPLVALVASANFAESGSATLSLLFIAVALVFLTGTLSQALFAAHDQGFLLWLNIANLLGNIVLNLALVPRLGAVGASLALIVSEVSGLVAVSLRLRRRSPYRTPWGFLVKQAPSAMIAMAVAILLRGWPVLAAGALAGLAYLAVNLILGPVRISTLKSMRTSGVVDQNDPTPRRSRRGPRSAGDHTALPDLPAATLAQLAEGAWITAGGGRRDRTPRTNSSNNDPDASAAHYSDPS